MSWLRKRAERKVPAILRPDSKTDKVRVGSRDYTLERKLRNKRDISDLFSKPVKVGRE